MKSFTFTTKNETKWNSYFIETQKHRSSKPLCAWWVMIKKNFKGHGWIQIYLTESSFLAKTLKLLESEQWDTYIKISMAKADRDAIKKINMKEVICESEH